MVICLALALLQTAKSVEAADFFPSTVGTTWTYEESTDLKSAYVDKIVEPLQVSGEPAITIETKVNTKVGEQVVGLTAYKVVGDTVFAVAFGPKLVLSEPHPILKIGTGAVSWEFKGVTPLSNVMLPLEFKATSTWIPKQKLFGEERDCVSVDMTAKIQEAGGLVTTNVHQTSTYAKGIGMVEMKETTTVKKSVSSRSVKLIKFEQPK